MTYIFFFFKEEPVATYYEMIHDIFSDSDDYQLELNYHIVNFTPMYSLQDTVSFTSEYKVKIYNEPSTAINVSEKARQDRLKLFHRIFKRNLNDYFTVEKVLNLVSYIPTQYQLLNFLPYQLSLNISADKEFKELFLIIPFEKAVKQNLFHKGNFRVEIFYENKIINPEFIEENQNDFFIDLNRNMVSNANQMRVLLDSKEEEEDEDNSIHKTKSLF